MKRLLTLFSFIFAFTVLTAVPTQAATETSSHPDLNYNLTVGGTQSTVIKKENGQTDKIEVREEPNLFRMANKTYTVTKKSGGWKVSYKIKVKSNKIVSVFGLNAVATVGSFKSSSLKKVSSKKAAWKAIYTVGLYTKNVSCIATISNGALHIN